MSLLNLISILTLALVVISGVAVRRWLRRYLNAIDGVMGLSNRTKIENDRYL